MFGLLLILFSAVFADAQTEHIKIETKEKELSFSIPASYTFYEDDDDKYIRIGKNKKSVVLKNLRSIIASENGVTFWLESYDVDNGEEIFKYYPNYDISKGHKATDYIIGKSKLREIIFEDDNRLVYKYYFFSDKRFYVLGVGMRRSNSALATAFLSSFSFNGKAVFSTPDNKPFSTTETLILEDMKSTPLEISYKVEESDADDDKSKNVDEDADKTMSENSNDLPLTIFEKVKPSYTNRAREKNERGKVRLKVEFGKDGLVKRVILVKGLKFGLNEKAINAARLLKFLPPEKSGIPYTVTKFVEYNFDIY